MPKQSRVSPIDDLTFDVLTVLREKAKALAAYETYLADADADDDDEVRELFVEMQKQDGEHAQVLKEVLARRLEDDLGYDDAKDAEDADDVDDDAFADDYDDDDDEGEVDEPASVSTSPRTEEGR
jgi:hypothetical protein